MVKVKNNSNFIANPLKLKIMARVLLEIDEVKIYRPRKRWHLYFVVVADHPTEKDKMIVATLPQ